MDFLPWILFAPSPLPRWSHNAFIAYHQSQLVFCRRVGKIFVLVCRNIFDSVQLCLFVINVKKCRRAVLKLSPWLNKLSIQLLITYANLMLSHERALRLLTLLSNLNIGFHCLLSCMITPREVLSIKRKYCQHLVIHFLSYFPCLNKVTYVKYRPSSIVMPVLPSLSFSTWSLLLPGCAETFPWISRQRFQEPTWTQQPRRFCQRRYFVYFVFVFLLLSSFIFL